MSSTYLRESRKAGVRRTASGWWNGSGLEQRAARAGPERPRSGAYVFHLNVVGLRWDGVRHRSSNLVSPPKAQPGCRGDYVTCPLTGRSSLELYGRDGGAAEGTVCCRSSNIRLHSAMGSLKFYQPYLGYFLTPR